MRRFSMGAVFLALVGCPTPNSADDAAVGIDAGTPPADSGARDSGRPDGGSAGDPFAAYMTGLSNARRQECTCSFEEQGFDSIEDCLRDQLMNDDIIQCEQVGYMAARSAAAARYRCAAPLWQQYADCRMAAGCDDSTAIRACIDGVSFDSCPELPEEATEAIDMCIGDMFIGPVGTCPAAMTWSGVGTFTGTTRLAGNDTSPADAVCFPSGMATGLQNAADDAHTWTPATSGRYRIDTVGTEFDTILYLRRTCGMEVALACNDDIDPGVMTNSRLEFDAIGGMPYIIVVDGYTISDSGPYTVNIARIGDIPDAGGRDGGMRDAGPVDAGPMSDAGPVDAGPMSDAPAPMDAPPAVDAPPAADAPSGTDAPAASFASIHASLQSRCTPCHDSNIASSSAATARAALMAPTSSPSCTGATSRAQCSAMRIMNGTMPQTGALAEPERTNLANAISSWIAGGMLP